MSARSLMVMCALAAMTHCAKSEIVAAQEQPGNGRIVVNDPTAQIGTAEKHVKTPWMIVSPDGKRGFANDFTTNAISVVSEDGINYYAHQEDENGDRTKVIHFTVDENGIPSRTGDVIDTTNSGETNNAENMKKRKLIGVKNGYLYFYPFDEYFTSLIYNPETSNVVSETTINYDSWTLEPENKKCLASFQYNNGIIMLHNVQEQCEGVQIVTRVKEVSGSDVLPKKVKDFFSVLPENSQNKIGCAYCGDGEGNIFDIMTPYFAIAKLPGAISGLSDNRYEVFATTKATNAFYNVTLGQ